MPFPDGGAHEEAMVAGGGPERAGPAAHGQGLAWRVALPVVLLLAGVLFATSAETSDGTDLRGGRWSNVQHLIAIRTDDVESAEQRAAQLRRQIDEATRDRARTDARLSGPQRDIGRLSGPAGFTAVRGPALTVQLDDAPRRQDGSLPEGARPDDVVVHQQDVQAVVNALWAGGAEAMTIMGIRVISTSAVRCVGNTLLLHGRTYSPPFVITAIGRISSMQDALDRSPGVSLFRQAARDYGLGYRLTPMPGGTTLPPYDGALGLRHAATRSR